MTPDGATPGATTPDAACPPPAGPILCARHGVELVATKVQVAYQGHTFPVDVLACPICGQPLITEDLARGRMLEVEQTLEEK
jgi:hypothetical protein